MARHAPDEGIPVRRRLAIVVRWITRGSYTRQLFRDLHSGAVGLLFTALGVWLGISAASSSTNHSHERPLAPSDLSLQLVAGQPHDTELAFRGGLRLNVDERTFETVALRAVLTNRGKRAADLPQGTALDLVTPLFNPRTALTRILPYAQLVQPPDFAPVLGPAGQSTVELIGSRASPITLLNATFGWLLQTRDDPGQPWATPRPLRSQYERDGRAAHHYIPLHALAGRLKPGGQVRVTAEIWVSGTSGGPRLAIDAKARVDDGLPWSDWNLPVRPGVVVSSFGVVANVGARPANNVVVRWAAPPATRFVPLSGREGDSGDPSLFPVEDNLTNGGFRYPKAWPSGLARYFFVRARFERFRPQLKWLDSYWLVKSRETHGKEFFDPVRFLTPRAPSLP
jgi:hypothetical protein